MLRNFAAALAMLSAAAFATSASAQSCANCAPFDWSGWSLGAHAGGGAESVDGRFLIFDLDSLNVAGGVAGGQLGYLEQAPSGAVYGLEIDASLSSLEDGLSGSVTFDGEEVQVTIPFGVDVALDWLVSARGKLGLASGDFLPFVTGGVAIAGYAVDAYTGAAAMSVDDVMFGAVLGAGADYKIAPNWTLGGEGLYYMFDETVSLAPVGNAGDHVDLGDVFLMRARLNYKF